MPRPLALALAAMLTGLGPTPDSQPDPWIKTFQVQKSELRSIGRNTYWILEPGFSATLDGGDEHLVITVLKETRLVDGVETRVVEERETKGGKLVEVSRNYFAISSRSSDVYYFGEDVDIYRDGRVVNHDGSWLAGTRSAKFGMMMPGRPVVGFRHYQEVAGTQAMDRAEVLSTTEAINTPAGSFRGCLKVEETSPLEPGTREHKFYAPGVGLVQEGELKLVRYGPT